MVSGAERVVPIRIGSPIVQIASKGVLRRIAMVMQPTVKHSSISRGLPVADGFDPAAKHCAYLVQKTLYDCRAVQGHACVGSIVNAISVAKIAPGVIEVPKLAQLGMGRVALEKRLFLVRHAGGLLCLADEVEFGVEDPWHEYVSFELWSVLQVAIGLLVKRFQLYEN